MENINLKIVELKNLLNKKFGEGDNFYYGFEKGKKYFKIYLNMWGSKSVYAFIDFEGNIYKAASCSAPAKHIRGTLNNPLACCNKYSVQYLK